MHSRSSLQQAVQNQTRRLESSVDSLGRQSKQLSNYRLIVFIAGVIICSLAARTLNPWIFGASLVLFIAVFGYLVVRHRQVDEWEKKFSTWKKIRKTHLARMNLDWSNMPEPMIEYRNEDHPFAQDLDITGLHSLHQLINTAIYQGGSHNLYYWLTSTEPKIQELKHRHRIVQELTPMAHFRDRLQLESMLAKSARTDKDWTMETLVKWLRRPHATGFKLPMILLGTLSTVNIILLILWLTGTLGPYVIFTFVFYLLIYNFNSQKVAGLFDDAYQIEKLLTRFRSILEYLELYKFKNQPALKEFCHVFQDPDSRPSLFIKKITRLASAASSQSSELIWFLLNAAVPWDMYFAWRLNNYKEELAPRLEVWLNHFYELEALSSLANFAWLNPRYTFALPSVETDPAFKAEGLGHPLIPEPEKVVNDITIKRTGDILLITGSNMAGKSTFLRTVGLNLALCFAGGPVNANQLDTIPFRLFTSINVRDSLDQGLSHFYAEVKRLRKLLKELKRPHSYPLFFFVDEIFKGTNNRERLIGSTAFLQEVAGRNGIGMVSTHDLELAQLEEEIPVLSNWHFEETIQDGKMSFEYKLKPGPCPTTNALKIMEMEGLPIGKS